MQLTYLEMISVQIAHPELIQVNAQKSLFRIDPISGVNIFKYDFINPPANHLLYCDVIEPELVCLLVNLDYAPAV